VVAHKCAQHNDELGRIAIASRNISKCQAIIDSVKAKGSLKQPADIQAFALDALDVEATKALIVQTESQIVINVGSAFLNMSVLRACTHRADRVADRHQRRFRVFEHVGAARLHRHRRGLPGHRHP